MFYVKTEIRESKIAGRGVFTLEPIKKGQIVANFPRNAKVITEEEYQEEQRKGNKVIIQSGVRWVGKEFLYKPEIDREEYINHSNSPNLLYHCGICFAKRDINIGEELTANYRYFLAENDVYAFKDNEGKLIDGLSPKEALLQSSKELVELLEEVEEVS